jgi:hypothetical protein
MGDERREDGALLGGEATGETFELLSEQLHTIIGWEQAYLLVHRLPPNGASPSVRR